MKRATKTVKVNSLSLAKAAAQFLAKIEFDLQPLLQDKILAESIHKVHSAVVKLEEITNAPEKSNATELASEFQKTDKALDKIKDKVNDLHEALEKIEKSLQEKLVAKFEVLRKTDPKEVTDTENRNKVEIHMKSIKSLLESAKKKLHEVQGPTEVALKRMQAIKPKLYALAMPDNFDRCQKRAEKLNEEIEDLCHATAEISLYDTLPVSTVFFKEATPVKVFLPKLQLEIEKSSKLLHQTHLHLRRIFPLGGESSAATGSPGAKMGNGTASTSTTADTAASASASTSSTTSSTTSLGAGTSTGAGAGASTGVGAGVGASTGAGAGVGAGVTAQNASDFYEKKEEKVHRFAA